MDEVLKSFTRVVVFRPDPPGADREQGQNRLWGPLLKKTSPSDRKATATNQMHSIDLEAFGKKCRFLLHNEVKTRF